jgi:hypothetical protein
VNNQEIEHINGNKLMDFPFPFQLRKVLVANDRVSLHHFFPTVVGGVSYWIKGVDDDNSQVIVDLFRLQCNRVKPPENYMSSIITKSKKYRY